MNKFPTSQSAAERTYYLLLDDKEVGPLSVRAIRAMVRKGNAGWDTLFAHDGAQGWERLEAIRSTIFPGVPAEFGAANRDDIACNEPPLEDAIADRDDFGEAGLLALGLLMIVVGIVCAFYFAVLFDTTVEGTGSVGHLHNIGLLNTQQNGIIIGTGLTLFGCGMLVLGRINALIYVTERWFRMSNRSRSKSVKSVCKSTER